MLVQCREPPRRGKVAYSVNTAAAGCHVTRSAVVAASGGSIKRRGGGSAVYDGVFAATKADSLVRKSRKFSSVCAHAGTRAVWLIYYVKYRIINLQTATDRPTDDDDDVGMRGVFS